MRKEVSEESAPQEGVLLLRLTEIENLFRAPRIESRSESAAEVLGISGFDYLLDVLHQNRKKQRARTLVLVVPVDEAIDALCEEITDGLHRVAMVRLDQQRRELENTCRYGWKIAGGALLILAICIGLSSVFSSPMTEWMRPLLRTTLERGFEIIGWVMLWHPIEVLGFTPVTFRARIAALKTLAEIRVIIRAAPTTLQMPVLRESQN
jgi:hypothetical protein